MIKRPTYSGDIVRHPDGRIGLVTGWIGEGDGREVMLVMRRTLGLSDPFDFQSVPINTYLKTFFLLGNIESEYQSKEPIGN